MWRFFCLDRLPDAGPCTRTYSLEEARQIVKDYQSVPMDLTFRSDDARFSLMVTVSLQVDHPATPGDLIVVRQVWMLGVCTTCMIEVTQDLSTIRLLAPWADEIRALVEDLVL
jgi:hypothetical protein